MVTSKKPTTVNDYIDQFPPEVRKKLTKMREILEEVTPNAEESVKWSVPAFSYHRILYTYAGFKHHIGFYPTPAVMQVFKKELEKYEIGKGSIQFPLDQPLPKSLIQKIATFRIKDLKDNDAKWM